MYFRRKTSAGRAYLQNVESRRDGEAVIEAVVAELLARVSGHGSSANIAIPYRSSVS
jgi:hypothetical protein